MRVKTRRLPGIGIHLRRSFELVSRRRNSYKSFGELRAHLAGLKVKNAVFDGALVCLDAKGRSIFNELLLRRGCPIFYAFESALSEWSRPTTTASIGAKREAEGSDRKEGFS
jgi:hypothetical protein